MTFFTKKQAKLKTCPCGERFTPTRSIQKYHSPQCEMKFKAGKFESEDLTSLPHSVLMTIAKGECHEYVRLRDKDLGCISCDTPADAKGVVWQAGHLFNANQFSGTELDARCVNRQCETCNCRKDGNYDGYVTGFKKRFGSLEFEMFYAFAHSVRSMKYSRPELIEFIQKYREMTNKLKSNSQ